MHCKHGTYVGTPHGADHMCGYCESGTEPPVYIVEMGVKGASRIVENRFDSQDEAVARAVRWASSNSIGSYWAEVVEYVTDGVVESFATVASFNL